MAIVTGVSRSAGIGYAIARALLEDGCRVLVHSWTAHDARHPWGAQPGGVDEVLAGLRESGGELGHVEADFTDPAAPRRVVADALSAFGAVDVLIANHAHSSRQTLEQLTAEELDRSWAVNARAVALLVQAYAAAHDDCRPHGRVVLLTSGQHLGPMAGELPYAISKGAVHQMTRSLADAVAARGISVNAVNPGPVDTGWASPELRARLTGSFPRGRWGTPGDIAEVVRWLASPASAWVTGQVIDAEGGFRREPPG